MTRLTGSPEEAATADARPRRLPDLSLARLTPARVAGGVVLALALLRSLAPPVGGIVTNDSVGYLARSRHPFSYGFVVQGYRQAGYTVWIHLLDWLGNPFGLDTVFTVALAQRLMLLLGVVLLWGAVRWWSLPVLVVVTSGSYVIYTDYVLMEGFLVPAALLVAALAASVVTGSGVGARHPRAALVACAALAVAMGATKLQYAVALVLACAIAWLVVRDGATGWRFALVTLGVSGVLVSGLAVGQTFENHRELGAWEPVGERARAEWYGGWEAVFQVHPDNRRKPQLAEYYDHGDLYVFLHGLEATEPDYATRQREIRARVQAMFAAAGTTRTRQEAGAFLGAVGGGRTDDIAGITNRVQDGGVDGLRAWMAKGNQRANQAAVIAAVDHGRETKVLSTGPVTSWLQALFDDYRPAKGWLGYAAAVLALLGCAVRGRHRAYVAASTVALVGVCGVLASAYIDNARYLVSPMTISLVGATLGVRALVLAVLARRTPAPVDAGPEGPAL